MRPMGMHWHTEILFSKDNIKQSSNNLDYQGQRYVGVYRGTQTVLA